jgi:predicted nucleic acid-binding protein
LRHGREDLAREYRDIILRSPSMTALPADEVMAEEAARLRALYGVKAPDAIHLATGLVVGATHFLTNDGELPALPNMSLLVLDRLQAP